jgi:hypothetical protein
MLPLFFAGAFDCELHCTNATSRILEGWRTPVCEGADHGFWTARAARGKRPARWMGIALGVSFAVVAGGGGSI